MATFPTSLPSYLGFTSTHTLVADLHASQHNSEQGDITAIATKIGTGASTPTVSKLLRGTGTGTSAWAQADLTSDVTGVLPVANGGNGTTSTTGTGSAVFANNPTLTTPVLTTPTIIDFTNADHDHSNTSQGGSTLNSPTIVTPTINQINGTDHIKLVAATAKLVKLTVLRQDDTVNTYQAGNSVILTGWGVIVPGVTNTASETVNFGVTFSQPPIVILTPGGDATAATTYGAGNNTIQGNLAGKATAITTTSFAAYVFAPGNWAAGNTVFYQWMAIGEIT